MAAVTSHSIRVVVNQPDIVIPPTTVPVVGLAGGSRNYGGPVGDFVNAGSTRPLRTNHGVYIPPQPSLQGQDVWSQYRSWWTRTDQGGTALYERTPAVALRGGQLTGVARHMHFNNKPRTSSLELRKSDLWAIPGVRGSNNMAMYTAFRFHPHGGTYKGPLLFNMDHTAVLWQIERDLSMKMVWGRVNKNSFERKEYYEQIEGLFPGPNLDSEFEWIGDWSQYPGKPKLVMDFTFGDVNIVEHRKKFWFTDSENHTIVEVNRDFGETTDPHLWRAVLLAGEFGNPNFGPDGFGWPTSIDYYHPGGYFFVATGGDLETNGELSPPAPPRTHGAVWKMTMQGQLTKLFDLDAAVCVRWTPHQGGGIIITDATSKVWEYNLASQQLVLLQDWGPTGTGLSSGFPTGWHWVDVDRFGTCGPIGQFANTLGLTNDPTRLFIPKGDGTYDKSKSVRQGTSGLPCCGPMKYVHEGGVGHYPYTITFSDTEAMWCATGYGTQPLHVAIRDNAAWQHYGTAFNDGATGGVNHLAIARQIHRRGTVKGFAGRPPFEALLTERGSGDTGVPIFDDIAAMTDAEQTAHIQGGMGASVPRPEIRGLQLEQYKLWIKVNSHLGQVATTFTNPPWTVTGAAPTVNAITLNGNVVTFTTNVPTICQVRFGDSRGLWRYTNISSADATSHSFTMRHTLADPQIQIVAQTTNGLVWETPVLTAPSNATAATVAATEYQAPQIVAFGPYGLKPHVTRSGNNFTFRTWRNQGNSGNTAVTATMIPGLSVVYIIDGVEVTGPVDGTVNLTIPITGVEQKWHWASLLIVDVTTNPMNYRPEAVLFNTDTTMYF